MAIRIKTVRSLAVIGDLHLGAGDKRDNWDYGNDDHGCRELPFSKRIGGLQRTYDVVGQVGDAFDLWERLLRQIAEHLKTLSEIVLKQLAMVYGNHDKKLRTRGIPEVREYMVGEHLGGYVHGHQGDFLNNEKGEAIGRGVNRIWGFFEIILPQKWARWLEEKFSNPPPTPASKDFRGDRNKYVDWAYAYAKERGWKWIVFGHSHRKGKWIRGGIAILNAGSCLYPYFEYAWLKVGEKGKLLSGVESMGV